MVDRASMLFSPHPSLASSKYPQDPYASLLLQILSEPSLYAEYDCNSTVIFQSRSLKKSIILDSNLVFQVTRKIYLPIYEDKTF